MPQPTRDPLAIPAPPWSRNPSAWSQRVGVAVLAGAGVVVSAYLALYQWRLIDSVWDPVFGDGSENVLDSNVSHRMRGWLGVPDAALGTLAYLGDLIYGLAGSTRRWQCRPWMVILFGIDVIPLGIVSVVLVVLQGTVVGHWCFLCLVSAAISLGLIALAYDEVWSSIKYLARVWRQSRQTKTVWRAFVGVPVAEAG